MSAKVQKNIDSFEKIDVTFKKIDVTFFQKDICFLKVNKETKFAETVFGFFFGLCNIK